MNQAKERKDGISYLWMSLICFLYFLLEVLLIITVERILFHFAMSYTETQKGIHCILTTIVWAFASYLMIRHSVKKYQFPKWKNKSEKIEVFDWFLMMACFVGMKVMTYIDWKTLKVIGEFQKKTLFHFSAQYIYYFLEIALIVLIIIFGQKAFEVMRKKETQIPFGGIILAVTWGAYHFISGGGGLWNGLSCMIFSVLAGFIYVKSKSNLIISYILIAIGYLL